MSSVFCRLFYQWLQRPTLVLTMFLLVTLGLAPTIYSLQIKSSLLDFFGEESLAATEARTLQNGIGGLSNLTVIFKHQDSSVVADAVRQARKQFELRNEIAAIETAPFAASLKERKWLHVSLTDLNNLKDQLDLLQLASLDPLAADALDKASSDSAALVVQQLSQKYAKSAQDFLGSPDGQIRFVRLIPKTDAKDIEQSLAFFKMAEQIVNGIQYRAPGVEVLYGGRVYDTFRNEGHLARQMWGSSWIALGFVALGLGVVFYRQPLVSWTLLIPALLSMTWTLGIWSLFKGEIHALYVAVLPLVLSVSVDGSLHLFSRYEEERRKELGPRLAFETALLEKGPTLFRTAMTTALAFLSLSFVSFPAIRDLGVLAALALVMAWFHSQVFFPALMILIQRKSGFPVYGSKLKNFRAFRRVRYPHWRIPALVGAVLLFTMLPYTAKPTFDRNFAQTGPLLLKGDSILFEYGENLDAPIVIRDKSPEALARVTEEWRKSDPQNQGMFARWLSPHDLNPVHTAEKLKVLAEIQVKLTPGLIEQFPENLRKSGRELLHLNLQQIPKLDSNQYYQAWFVEPQTQTYVAYALPKNPISTMDEARKIRDEAAAIVQRAGSNAVLSGDAFLLTEYLNQTLPYVPKSLIACFILVALLLLLEYRNGIYVAMIILPTAATLILAIGALRLTETPFHPLNIFLLPLFIGLAVDANVHMLDRYLEEGRGSIPHVMRRTLPALGKSAVVTALAFLAYLNVHSPLAKGISLIGITAIGASLLSAIFIQPLFLIKLDQKRWLEWGNRVKLDRANRTHHG